MSKVKNDLRLETLNKYAEENYAEEIERLTLDNAAYSTRLYALIRYLEGYWDIYIQNRKEIEKLTTKIVRENTNVNEIKNSALRTLANRLNKLKNLDERMDGFVKLFNKEFAQNFKNPELEEELLDLMEDFWESVIKVEDGKIFIKTKNNS